MDTCELSGRAGRKKGFVNFLSYLLINIIFVVVEKTVICLIKMLFFYN